MSEIKGKNAVVKRLGGYLHKVVPLVDESGKVIQRFITPLMVEVRNRDIMQIVIGSSILAIPVAYTEESWNLGSQLPLMKIILISLLSLLFISLFVYYNFYKNFLKDYKFEFVKRVILIYLVSMVMVALILTLIEKCPWGEDNILAIKRIVLVSLPSSMSAAVTDSLK